MSDYVPVYKILIIDDDKSLQMMLKTVLASNKRGPGLVFDVERFRR